MYATAQDEIVELRTWIGSVEVVSRVNWSQIARVRRSLGLTAELGRVSDTKRFKFGKLASIAVMRTWRRAGKRAA